MKTETLHPVTDYISELFASLKISEGFGNGTPYFDTANPRRATIGYGFNKREKGTEKRGRFYFIDNRGRYDRVCLCQGQQG